jgi:hypothetical protein
LSDRNPNPISGRTFSVDRSVLVRLPIVSGAFSD